MPFSVMQKFSCKSNFISFFKKVELKGNVSITYSILCFFTEIITYNHPMEYNRYQLESELK